LNGFGTTFVSSAVIFIVFIPTAALPATRSSDQARRVHEVSLELSSEYPSRAPVARLQAPCEIDLSVGWTAATSTLGLAVDKIRKVCATFLIIWWCDFFFLIQSDVTPLFCTYLNLKLACRSQAFDDLSPFWDVCDDIDENCAVLEPDPPNRIASHRRIALGACVAWTGSAFHVYVYSPLFITSFTFVSSRIAARVCCIFVIMCLRRTPLLVAYQLESETTNAALRYSVFGR
jgi:hypothetical protein